MTKTNSATFSAGLLTAAILAGVSASAQPAVVYDNTAAYSGFKSNAGNKEIGDEITLSDALLNIVTKFQFEYHFNGADATASGVLRFYAKDGGVGNVQPGTVLFESASFDLLNGFKQGSANVPSVTVPGTFIWTVEFSGLDGADSAGLLYYGNPSVGSSLNDHWERDLAGFQTYADDPDILSDNFAARVTAVPEPGTWALLLGGLGVIGAAARRRKA